ncbi:aspartyl/asparaginyl beta-hydroxylase domain-containing protein [Nannocystis punicea]|uniref:Aspartyl/asparaginyl beta-hydroxylase domain-containing protein n=1 Tax=Nannocystis punicea TaxID=2995304 RepID=A0ABY7H8Q9_9BACT|nr:aspartyl/asparaginyl beta-hydroxylase domain-containing protein [Nannocystis poenicansa]WAS95651.1 aspartyl/asparaginyl beta-hydroxylase domain-containing protein [Nannocystis poenicansa]
MWRLSDADMFLLWKEVERRHGPRASARVEAMLVGMTGRGEPAAAPGQHVADFVFPGLPTRPWYEAEEFAWVPALEQRASQIHRAFRSVRAGGAGVEHYLPRDQGPTRTTAAGLAPPEEGWRAYFFVRDGSVRAEACRRCPEVAAALDATPLGLGDAMFSILAGRSEIPPHCGLNNLCLTCHLALEVPDACGLEAEDEARAWQAGRCLIFDDTFRHRAWNASDHERVVLLFDFWHPALTAVEREVLRWLIPRIRRCQPG